jgi:hypothetical protein
LKIPKGYSEAAIMQRWTYKKLPKEKSAKMTNKTLQRKLNIEQHKS